MTSKRVPIQANIAGQSNVNEMRVQGFRKGLLTGTEPVVVIALTDTSGTIYTTAELTVQDAHVLGEYLRSEAEFAGDPRNEEEK